MLTRLQLETRALHPEADAPWVDLMSSQATRDDYVATLLRTYGFEAPIEAAVALTPGMSAVLPLRQRARSGFIVQDLLSLGFTPSRIARLPQCSQIVPFRDVAEALGWMYVVERATLLHDTVRRALESRLPLQSFSYLSAYDGAVGQRWQDFGHALDYVTLTHDNGAAQIVAAARVAFAAQHGWVASEDIQQVANQVR